MTIQIRDYDNIHHMLKETVEQYPEKDAYRWYTDDGNTHAVTWGAFYGQVHAAAKSLMALGVAKGDKINILSYSCFRWVLADLAGAGIGACTVGIYQSNLPKDCQYIISHSDAVIVFAQDETQLEKLLEIRQAIPKVRKVVLLAGTPVQDEWVMDFETFLKLGDDISDQDLTDKIQSITPEDPAGIIYTSGTTGVPKGVVLTHDNITFTAQSVCGSCEMKEDYESFLFLPLAHVFARTCLYTALIAGNTLTFNRKMDTLVEDLQRSQPHWFASVPRIFEKVHSKIIAGAEAKGGVALKLFRWAMDVGHQVGELKLAKQPIPAVLDLKYKVADKLVFSKVQAALGGRVQWCISGAAPINPDIAKFFHAAGVLMVEGIGMSENTSFSHLNRADNYRFGWVGQPGPGVLQKIAEDGEILTKGRNVMQCYYKMPEETADTFTEDGWLRTGDIGEIDKEDFLRVTGRKKELIITAGGKNIAPAAIEGVLATSKYINQIFVIGDQKKYLSALVTLDLENVEDYAQKNQISFADPSELINHPKIEALINQEVVEKNSRFASFETIKRITIVPEFTIDNGFMTPTMKLKKNLISKEHAQVIEGMYPSN